jgi:anti-sigma-K factor RskA
MAATKPEETQGLPDQMTQAGDQPQDDSALVAEYALHLLDAPARLAFERRLADDAALRFMLVEWDERLVAFADEIDPVTPGAHVKPAVLAHLFEPQKRRFGFDLRTALAGLAIVALLLIVVVPQVWNTGGAPTYLAEIVAEDRGLIIQAGYDPDKAKLTLDRSEGAAKLGRSLELWVIIDGVTAPVSLGVMPVERIASIDVPARLIPSMILATLAISDEPLGGSPTGAPTGDVLAAGVIAPIVD